MRSLRLAVSLLLLGLMSPGCGGDSGPTPIIVDSDGGFDDIKAIIYLLQQPDIEVVAIALSGTGIAHCPQSAENVSALLEHIDAPDIPVACGRTTPLAGNNQAPSSWRNSADTLGGVDLPEPRPLSELSAPELLATTLDSAGEGAVLVALGPLTNLGEMVEDDPGALDQVDMMYLMGGAVDAGGNVPGGNPDAEFNIWADPTAAAIVFDTAVPITLVPLDATNYLPVTPYLYEAVAAYRDHSAVSQFVAEYLDVTPWYGGVYHWDELAAVAAIDESVVTIEERTIQIDADGVTSEDASGRLTRVATAADRAAFEERFYPAIIGTAEPEIAPWEPDAVMAWDGTACSYEGPDPLPSEFVIRLDNSGEEPMAFVTGIYAAGTTAADFAAAVAAADPSPDWWVGQGAVGAPTGAHEVWPARGGESVTALCFIGPSQIWEVAGPRLSE